MSYNNGPRIVTNDLVLHLDAGNSQSYPGSGNTWKNLASNDFNATMLGTVPYEIDVVPCWNFATATGTAGSASMGFTFASNMVTRTGDFSLSFWIKNPPSIIGQHGLFCNAGGADGYRFGIAENGIYYLIGPSYTESTIIFSSSLSASKWHNITCVFSRSTAQILLYVNGIYQSVRSIPAGQTIMQNNAPGLVRAYCCNLWTGKLSICSVYNSRLEAGQILQNYTALKGRFRL